jgi:predicted nucleic acid-binding protein
VLRRILAVDTNVLLDILMPNSRHLEWAFAAALWQAGLAWKRFLRQRPAGLVCPVCGGKQESICGSCGRTIGLRQHILSDFLIGAHAKIKAQKLLTRDRGFYRGYFNDLQIVTPAA